VKPLAKLVLVAIAVTMLAACEKPTAKFHPGDHVRVKITDTRGIVAARMSFFVADHYYLQVAGNERDFHKDPNYWQPPFVDKRTWHYEGPFEENDLELAKR
jgi:hypothetical protein